MAHQHAAVHIKHPVGQRFGCPEYGRELRVYDHLAGRIWRHLNSCQFLSYVHTRPPRVSCPEHDVHQVTLPWTQAGSQFTKLFEVLTIDVLSAANVKKAADILRITCNEADQLMERAVLRGRAGRNHEVTRQIDIDEKAIVKGHCYMTLVSDLEAVTVEYIGEGRQEKSLADSFEAFETNLRDQIEAISLDMWPAYIKACCEDVSGAEAKMILDRSHHATRT
jgi:transposase